MLRRRQATFLLLLATAVSSAALAAWALAPVQQEGRPATTTLFPFGMVSCYGGFRPADGEGQRGKDYCPRGVEVGADIECPPHKRGIHYEKYSLREYYGGEEGFGEIK
jgi:hypothetical protein